MTAQTDKLIDAWRIEPTDDIDADYELLTDIDSVKEKASNVIEQWGDSGMEEDLVIRIRYREMTQAKYNKICKAAEEYHKWIEGDD